MADLEAPRRTPKIGYSYPSGQNRAGPAPLASFEDLPSDDQDSPESEERRLDHSPSQEVIDDALEADSRDLLNASPDSSVTPVNDRSPDPDEEYLIGRNGGQGTDGSTTPVGDNNF